MTIMNVYGENAMIKDCLNRISVLVSGIHPAIIFLTLVLVFFGKVLIPLGGNFIGGMDVLNYHIWHLAFFKEQVLSGSIPMWNPYTFCGHPFWANPGNFILYPLIILYVILPLPWAFNIDQCIHFFIAGMGTFYLVRMITGSSGAGLVSAVIYSFSGHIMEGMYAGHLTKIHSAALLPWVFFFVEKMFKTGRFMYFSLAGVMLGLQILTGNTQNNLYTAYFVGLYFLMRYFIDLRKQGIRHFEGYCAGFLLVPMVSFGLAAAWLIPAWEFISLSDRARDTYEFATFLSFDFSNLFTLLVPQPETRMINTNWELGCYVGIMPLVLMFVGIFFSRMRRMAIGLAILVIISLTFMLGGNTPFYYIYYKMLPLIGKVRVPGRALIIFDFFISILAGIGAQYLIDNPSRKKVFPFLIVALIVVILGLFGGAQLLQVSLQSKGMLTAFVLTAASFSVFFSAFFMRSKVIVISLVIGIIFLDLFFIYVSKIPTINYNSIMTKRDYEYLFQRDDGFYRVMIPISLTGGLSDMGCRGNVFHYSNVSGDTPLVIKDFYKFVHNMAGVPMPEFNRHTLDLDLFLPETALSSKILGIKYAIVRTSVGFKLFRANWFMPKAQLIKKALVIPDYQNHLTMLKNPEFNPCETILLDKNSDKQAFTRSKIPDNTIKDDVIDIISYKPNRIELNTASRLSSYLLLSELFYPGWKAYVDGKAIPIMRADYLLRAIPLTPGRHNVIFKFRPLSIAIGLAISAITIGLILINLIYKSNLYKL